MKERERYRLIHQAPFKKKKLTFKKRTTLLSGHCTVQKPNILLLTVIEQRLLMLGIEINDCNQYE